MLIARILTSLLIAFVISSGTILYTFNKTKVYEASGTLQLFVENPYRIDQQIDGKAIQPPRQDDGEEIRDYNTQIGFLESLRLIKGVEQRLSEDELHMFMAPYQLDELSYPLNPSELLVANRRIESKNSWMARVHYQHPNPYMAARIANLFMEEYINYLVSMDIDFGMAAVEGLRIKVDQQREYVAGLIKEVEATRQSASKDPALLELAKIELKTQQAFLEELITHTTKIKASIGLTGARARIVDQAFLPFRHHSPNIPGNLSKGCSIALGAGFAFFLLSGLMLPKR